MQSNELSERVCRKMGIEPRIEQIDWVPMEVYPDLLTPEWAGKLQVMLWDKGWNVTSSGYQDKSWTVLLSKKWRAEHAKADTLPEAVCRAIDALPEGL